jgi:threonine/homoserine/homoserine lactone efflux protein
MLTTDLLGFALVYGLAAASPGPGVAAIVARGLSRGSEGAAAFVMGFTAGDVVWICLVAFGLAAAARAAGDLFQLIRYAGAAYLLFIAWRMWTAPPEAVQLQVVPERSSQLSAFLGGLSLTLGNPKSMVFFLAVVPTLVPLEMLDLSGLLQIFAVVLLLNPTVLGSYVFAAVRAQRLFRDAVLMQRVQFVFAVILAAVSITVVLE